MAGKGNNNREDIFKEAVRQYIEAQLYGKAPDLEEFVGKYPEFEDQIRQKLNEFRKVDSLFTSIVQTDQSDFEDTETGQELVGEKVGNFEIVKIIGRGGMGVVYLARDTKLDRSVAIKSIPPKLSDDTIARKRLWREAKLLASLNHPNIAVIHEIIENDDGAGYLVLEYIPGETLVERIAREPLKLKEILSIARQIAKAVSVAHKAGIIHRDLKPGNIKITPDGRIKVLDFGLAKATVTEGKSGEITATEPGRIMGTPAYMSPEQARGTPADHRTDIWSFGCIMYEMLTGQFPFEGQTATDTLARIIERQPDWELLPNETPENIRVILRRCLEKDPAQRLGNIEDAAIEISDTLNKTVTSLPAKLRRTAMIIGVVTILIILSGFALKFILQKQIQSQVKQIKLVVLPFENLGPAEDEWFADSMTDEIISRLAGIPGLGVISRTSAMYYKDKEKKTPQIAKELGVDYILEGTIQRERPTDPNSRIRIRSQLIKASDDTHVWAQNYDNDMREIFRFQSDVAEQVAQGLDIILLETQRQALKSGTTDNMEAYEYYLRGNDYFHSSYGMNKLEMAIKMYSNAVKLDPAFAKAYCHLSMAHSWMYFFYQDSKKEHIDLAWEAVRKAKELDPDLPETHQALGRYYYLGHLDYNRALKHLRTALISQPNNAGILSFIGFIQRRQVKFEDALENIKKAFENDPLNYVLATEVASTLSSMSRYSEAKRYLERAITLAPEKPRAYIRMAELYTAWEGSTENAWKVLKEAKQNYKALENRFNIMEIALHVLDEKYQEALIILLSKPDDLEGRSRFTPYVLRCAKIFSYMGDNQKAKEYYEQAVEILKSKITEDPNDARFHSSLGIAYSGLGQKEQAIREGKQGVTLFPLEKDADVGGGRIHDLALIYVMVGEYDKAVSQLDVLLSLPGGISAPYLRRYPAWEPLRDHPDFKKLLEAGK